MYGNMKIVNLNEDIQKLKKGDIKNLKEVNEYLQKENENLKVEIENITFNNKISNERISKLERNINSIKEYLVCPITLICRKFKIWKFV